MNQCYAYIRVSTVKQGERGVSLQEQQAAIERYATAHSLQIVERFEERLTAARGGRPIFNTMLGKLRRGEAQGLIMHKIDRGARNLRDWAALGELSDAGVAVHFANESLDLFSRGGRLSADIQAVVAADYVRNLREEARKGMVGRLKQGLLPFKAPLGYLDSGGGKVKTVDPSRAPLVRAAFELYASGRYSIDSLTAELGRLGLGNRRGRPLSRNSVAKILNNPFYAGLIRVRTTGESYSGKHTPLISMSLFNQVKHRLSGRIRSVGWTHDFTFRNLFRCSLCGRVLIGERQKGHKYYRCHTRGCPTRCFREEVLEEAMLNAWPDITLTDDERRLLTAHLEHLERGQQQSDDERLAECKMRLSGVKERMARLIDAFVDGALDKDSFEDRKRGLLEEQQTLEDSLKKPAASSPRVTELLAELLELVSSAQQSYRLANSASRRELAIRLCSNRTVAGKEVSIEPYFPLRLLVQRPSVSVGAPCRYATRTDEEAAKHLIEWAKGEVAKGIDLDGLRPRHKAS